MKSAFKFILLVVFLLFDDAQLEELLFKPSQETYEEELGNVTLICGDPGAVNCKWFLSGREINFSLEDRYFAKNSTSCEFTIDPIRADDDGRWLCQWMKADITVAFVKRLVVDDLNIIHGAQIVSNNPSNIQIKDGETAKLNCKFKSSAPACFWTKDDEVVAIKGRLEFTGDKYHGDCSIQINRVNWRDNGNWQCCYPKMDSWPVTKSDKVILNITVTPKNPVISVTGIALDEGSSVYIGNNIDYNQYSRCNQHYQNYMVGCWSEDGNPAAVLNWRLVNPEGKDLPFSSVPNLKGTNTLSSGGKMYMQNSQIMINLDQISSFSNSMLKTKLICEAKHFNYNNQTRSTFVWLVWSYYSPISRYG